MGGCRETIANLINDDAALHGFSQFITPVVLADVIVSERICPCGKGDDGNDRIF